MEGNLMQMIHDAVQPEMLEIMRKLMREEAVTEAAEAKAMRLANEIARKNDRAAEARDREEFARRDKRLLAAAVERAR